MVKRDSLSFRIISQVLLITITLFVLILWGYYYYSRNIIRNTTREYANQFAENIGAKIEQELQPLEKIPQMVSASLEHGLFNEDSIMVILQTIIKNNPEVYGACVAYEPYFFPDKGQYYMPYAYRTREGHVNSMFLGSHEYDYFYMDWYQIPKVIRAPYWSEPYYDEGGGNVLMATYSMPIYYQREGLRSFAGIATIDIELEELTELVSSVRIFESGYAFMVSRNGVAITHPDKSQIMNKSMFSNAEEWGAPVLREIGRDLMQRNSNFRDYNLPGRDKRWIYYTNLPSTQWAIAVVYPDHEMFAALRQMNLIIIVLIFAGLLLLTLLVVNVVNRLSAPLGKLKDAAAIIAGGNFTAPLPEVKTKDEMLALRNAFGHMQNQLAIYVDNLKETTAAKEKIESELRIARDIQMSMIPHTFPPFPDLPQIDLFALLKSAKEVGGDLYDFFVHDKNQFCFAIGDVSGKGVPASLFMAVTRTLLRSIADKIKSPSGIMKVLNESLAMNNDSCMFVTFFLGILNLETGTLTFSNAGHNPPVLMRANGDLIVFDVGKSIPLGLYENYEYAQSSIQFFVGDKIFAYTDGVNEAEDADDVLFGEDKMMDVLSNNKSSSPREIIHQMSMAIEKHIDGNSQSDDITMMVINYKG